jgi:hypothetical protein
MWQCTLVQSGRTRQSTRAGAPCPGGSRPRMRAGWASGPPNSCSPSGRPGRSRPARRQPMRPPAVHAGHHLLPRVAALGEGHPLRQVRIQGIQGQLRVPQGQLPGPQQQAPPVKGTVRLQGLVPAGYSGKRALPELEAGAHAELRPGQRVAGQGQPGGLQAVRQNLQGLKEDHRGDAMLHGVQALGCTRDPGSVVIQPDREPVHEGAVPVQQQGRLSRAPAHRQGAQVAGTQALQQVAGDLRRSLDPQQGVIGETGHRSAGGVQQLLGCPEGCQVQDHRAREPTGGGDAGPGRPGPAGNATARD